MDASTWIEQFAAALGTEAPDQADKDTLLSLASVAANASERLAAPISCWIVAKAGCTPEEALAVARELATRPGPGT